MKPYPAPTRNLRELDRAQKAWEESVPGGELTEAKVLGKYNALVGALSQHVSSEVWDQCLNTAYGYIASCQVKLITYQHTLIWYAYEEGTRNQLKYILGSGESEQEAKDDFWRQWKEKHDQG